MTENKTLSFLEGELTQRLHSLQENFLLRESVSQVQKPGFIDFISSDYLGLRFDKRLVQGAAECGEQNGAGAGASRVVFNENDWLKTLEEKVAELAQFPKSAFLAVFEAP